MTRLDDSPTTDSTSVAPADARRRRTASGSVATTAEAPDARLPITAAVQAVMSHRQILLVIFGLMSGMFLSALDQTVVGTAIRTIGDDLHGLDQQAWVTTAYLIVSTISTPLYGKLSDIFGRRPLFLFAISIFIIGSLASSFSQSMYELAGFRALQGLGAGGLMSLPLTIMGDMLAPRERAKYQGYFLAVFGISSVIGPLVGGLFAGANQILFITGWRWVFLINVPIGVFALFMVITFLHLPKRKAGSVRIDWWGASLVIVALVPLLLIAEQGRDWGWASPGAFICYVVGGVGIVAFIMVQRAMGDDAIIPLKLFHSRVFSMSTILGVLVGFGMFGALLTIPLYLQLVKGATPTQSGYLMIPMILGLMTSSIVSGQIIARTGKYRIFPTVGTAMMAIGFLWMTFLTLDKPIWYLSIGMVVLGLGLGQLMQTLTIASQNSVGARDMGVATSASTFFRQIGGTLGTAILFSVLFTRIPSTIQAAFTNPTLQQNLQKALGDPAIAGASNNRQIVNLLKSAQSGDSSKLQNSLNGDTSFLTSANHALSAPFLTGFSNAAVSVFQVSLIIVLAAFVLSLFFKVPPLRSKSPLQEAADEEAAAAKAARALESGDGSADDASADASADDASADAGSDDAGSPDGHSSGEHSSDASSSDTHSADDHAAGRHSAHGAPRGSHRAAEAPEGDPVSATAGTPEVAPGRGRHRA